MKKATKKRIVALGGVKMEMSESEAARHDAALAAGILPVEQWRAVRYSPEEKTPCGDTLWLGDLEDGKPDGIGYYLFKRDIQIYSPEPIADVRAIEYFGMSVYCIRWAMCHPEYPWQTNSHGDIAVETSIEAAKDYALMHRSSPAGWLVPDEEKQPMTKELGWWSKVDYPWDCCVGDKAYWSGYLSPDDGQPIGAGWYIRHIMMEDMPYQVHWMCGQGDLLPHVRPPLKECETMEEAQHFTHVCKEVLLPGSGADRRDIGDWQRRMET